MLNSGDGRNRENSGGRRSFWGEIVQKRQETLRIGLPIGEISVQIAYSSSTLSTRTEAAKKIIILLLCF